MLKDESYDSSIDEETEEQSELSLRETLEAAQAEVKSRARDEQGKFAPESQEVANPSTEVAEVAEVAPIEPAIKAPDAWDAHAKEKFGQLPPDLQQYISKREADIHKGFTKQDEDRNFGKQFRDVVSPYLPMIRAEGGEPIAAVQNILQSLYTLKNSSPAQRAEMILGMAREYGADFQHMYNTLGSPQQQVDPRYQQLEQKLSRLEQERQQEQAQREQLTNAQVVSEIESFASDPKNTHFQTVKTDMGTLLEVGKASSLQEAYEMACYMNPQIRPLMIQGQTQSKTNEVAAKAQKAKQAGASVAGAPSGASKAAPIERDLRSELEAQFRAARNS